MEPCDTEKWVEQIRKWDEEHPLKMKSKPQMTPQDIIEEMNRQFDDAIIVSDVGQHQMFVSQYTEITEKKRMIMSGGLGTMGYGFPGAIGAQIGNPDKRVIAVSGDGGMQMNIQEFATAVLEELPLILCVFNNEYLGMVRQWQKAVLWKTLQHDKPSFRRSFPENERPGDAGVYAGFCEACRKLRGKRTPGFQERRDCGSV